ncbi:MAG TPA: FAD-dependent oxidoreductase [Streptosporangiaceae bacterium]|nr:FAD-dependent oxidoreductase [Streptosporangiaceae bacterium]
MPADVVIIGGGLEGLSIAYYLGESGMNVTVLERGELCAGGTAKSSGVVRCHYTVRSLAAMAWFALRQHEALGAEVGFHQVGYLVGVGAENAAALEHNVRMHQDLGIEVRILDGEAARAHWPSIETADFAAFAYEPRSGYGDAYQLGMAYARMARTAGVTIRRHTPVRSLLDKSPGVELVSGEILKADLVILAAGPWSPGLAATIGLDLPIMAQREEIVMIRPGTELLYPCPVFGDLVSLQYVKPEASGELLWGNADHSNPEYADPDRYSNRASVDAAVEKMAHRFPGLPDPRITNSYAGVYDVTPDFNPIIDRIDEGLLVAAGFSGHGFKISPAVGRLVADMVAGDGSGIPGVDPGDFRLSRFAEDRPLMGPHTYTTIQGHV